MYFIAICLGCFHKRVPKSDQHCQCHFTECLKQRQVRTESKEQIHGQFQWKCWKRPHSKSPPKCWAVKLQERIFIFATAVRAMQFLLRNCKLSLRTVHNKNLLPQHFPHPGSSPITTVWKHTHKTYVYIYIYIYISYIPDC